jgi:hypothetical protein
MSFRMVSHAARCPTETDTKSMTKPFPKIIFILALLCITLAAEPLPFLNLYRGLTETSREKQGGKNQRSAVRRHGVIKANDSATNK